MDTKNGTKYGRKRVKFKTDWTIGDDIILPEYAHKNVVCSHTRRYHNCLYLLAGLNSCARDLMDYIAEEMDSNNFFYSNQHFRQSFQNFIKENVSFFNNATQKKEVLTYSDSSIKKALGVLTSKGLIRGTSKGVFRVNPEYFFKNDDKKRVDMIVIELEFKEHVDTKLRILQEQTGIKNVGD